MSKTFLTNDNALIKRKIAKGAKVKSHGSFRAKRKPNSPIVQRAAATAERVAAEKAAKQARLDAQKGA